MKKTKIILSVLLVGAIVLSLCACGNKNAAPVKLGEGTAEWNFVDDEFKNEFEERTASVQPIDADAIFDTVVFDENILEGCFSIEGFENGLNNLIAENSLKKVALASGECNITKVPAAVMLGEDFMGTHFDHLRWGLENSGYEHIANLVFGGNYGEEDDDEEDNTVVVTCAYKVEGNSIIFSELVMADDENGWDIYVPGKAEFKYTFARRGLDLALSAGSSSVILRATAFTSDAEYEPELFAYSAYGSPLINGMDDMMADSDGSKPIVTARSGDFFEDAGFKLKENGTATVYLSTYDYETDTTTDFAAEYAYIVNAREHGMAKIIFFDGEKVYRYTDSFSDREERQLAEDGIKGLSENAVEDIAEKKKDLFEALQKEFNAQGIDAVIDRVNGEIALSSTVLFGGDSAVVTDEGKTLLDKFLTAYITVITQDEFKGFIDKTFVEGHTAPTGSSEQQDKELSQQRADNVKAYCLTSAAGAGLDAGSLEAVGKASTKPVYGEDGEIDMDACRRVSFRFLVNVDDYSAD